MSIVGTHHELLPWEGPMELAPPTTEIQPYQMDEAARKRFDEAKRELGPFDLMPFGKHKGKPICKVPCGYFDWLAEQKFLEHWPGLRKYMEARGWKLKFFFGASS